MAGATFGDVGASLFLAGTTFGDVGVLLFAAGAAFGDVGVPLFVAGATFGDVGASFFVAGATLVMLERHCSCQAQPLVTFMYFSLFFKIMIKMRLQSAKSNLGELAGAR